MRPRLDRARRWRRCASSERFGELARGQRARSRSLRRRCASPVTARIAARRAIADRARGQLGDLRSAPAARSRRNSACRSLRNRRPSGVGRERRRIGLEQSARRRPRRARVAISASGNPVRSANSDAGTPSVEAQRVQHELEADVVARHRGGPPAAARRRRPARGTAAAACSAPAHDAVGERQLGVRAGADAEVVAELPVVEVVPALAPGLRVRRGLVVHVAGGGERRVDRVLDVGRRVLVGQRRRMAVEQRVGLERQLVERQVRRRERERRREVGARRLAPSAPAART